MKRLVEGISIAALAALLAAPAIAQEAQPASNSTSEETGLSDIVVTAQRRSENLQKAALSIVAISGDTLATHGVNNIDALASQTAGVEIQPSGGPYTTFTVRSVSNLSGNAFSDPSIAVNINGVYLATPTTFRGLFYDLERVEVLKGPQGTLYGRNATGGAINLIAAKPRFTFGGTAGMTAGNYGHIDFNAALNLSERERLQLHVAGVPRRRAGHRTGVGRT